MPINIELGLVQRTLDWVKTKLLLDTQARNAQKRAIKRGQVYRCNFGVGVGSEMQKDRPAVIIQNNVGNKNSGNTIVIPITHDTSTLPCVVPIAPHYEADGVTLLLDGQANASNMMCVSKARLGDFIDTLSSSDMKAIDEAIAKTVGLMGYYSALEKQLNDKLAYIEKIKEDRNSAQDALKAVCTALGLEACISTEDLLIVLQKHIDKAE